MSAPTIVSGHTTAVDATNTTSHVVSAPTHSAGDLIYIVAASDGNADLLTAPSGFSTLYDNIPIETDALSKVAVFAVFYKTAGASEPATYTVTSSVSERCGMIAFAVTGAGSIDASGANTRGSSATATLPAVTTTVADTLRISLVGTDVDTTPHGTASTLTKLAEAGGSSSGTVSVYYKTLPSSGLSASETVSLNISEQWVTRTFALAPAAGNVTVTPAAASALSSAPAPTVVLGSLTITPAVASASASATLGALLNSVLLTPSAASATSSASIGGVFIEGPAIDCTLPRRRMALTLLHREIVTCTLPPRSMALTALRRQN